MKPLFALASACALLVATPVFACSEAEAEKMGKEVATKVASITQKNPQRARNSTSSCASARKPALEQNRPSDCDAYAQMLKELDQEKVTYSATLRSDPPVRGAAARTAGSGARDGAPPTPPESLRQARAEQHDAGTDHAQGHAQPVAP